MTDVDFGLASPYGTFGQLGNVWEWNETVVSTYFYGRRGGSFWTNSNSLESAARNDTNPDSEDTYLGFRVASLAPIVVPEPSTYAAIFGAFALVFVAYRRRSIAPKK